MEDCLWLYSALGYKATRKYYWWDRVAYVYWFLLARFFGRLLSVYCMI